MYRTGAMVLATLLSFSLEARSQDLESYLEACRDGDQDACARWGARVTLGLKDPNTDLAKVVERYRKACEAGVAVGCFGLGLLYGAGEGVPKDPAKAQQLSSRASELWDKACEAGDAESCTRLANMIDFDKATDDKKPVPMTFVREDGAWKVCSTGPG